MWRATACARCIANFTRAGSAAEHCTFQTYNLCGGREQAEHTGAVPVVEHWEARKLLQQGEMKKVVRLGVGGVLCVAAVLLSACAAPVSPPPPAPAAMAVPPAPPQPQTQRFIATAYSQEGVTAAGDDTRRGIVAADPAVLPLGSRIRVLDAGSYSGVYVVKDTGRKIDGHHIDIYIPDHQQAKRFGKRTVRVQVLDRGEHREAER